ncbi:hypothetical protein EA58_20570 [Photobacterium galatheae]|uniref:Uncharacterized protein n=1 Tax=Photobacterium galatheae TaxID=1654360 RepID=A0A066RQ89_9GAMM|nr:hypothetical protein EA58_20570 [Photobacterium galatheae]
MSESQAKLGASDFSGRTARDWHHHAGQPTDKLNEPSNAAFPTGERRFFVLNELIFTVMEEVEG